MANSPSQVKRHRQSLVRRHRNKAVRSALKTHMKRFRQAAEAGDRTLAEGAYRSAARQLDKAAQKGVVHANFAANKKSKMAQELSGLEPGPASP